MVFVSIVKITVNGNCNIKGEKRKMKRICKNCEALDRNFYVKNTSQEFYNCRLGHKIKNNEGIAIPCEECEKPLSMKKLIEIITKKGLPLINAVYSRSNRGSFLNPHP